MRFFILIFAVFSLIQNTYGQEIIVIDDKNNPIVNVSAFNFLKTKSVLSSHNGVINLSRFLSSDTIYLQHPNYKLKKLTKNQLGPFIKLETAYSMLTDVIISENKNLNNIKNDAAKKIHITKSDAMELSPNTTASLLEKAGGISVQMSQMGGGSPNIRGFEANRILLVLDGIRLNNAIYRSGHLQNIITVDQHIIEDVEVIFGPSSVLYGSDAIGGIINLKTPDLYFRSSNKWSGRFFSNYNSSHGGRSYHLSTSYESKNYASISGFSFKNFGDLKMGSYRPHGHDEWGLVYHYIDEKGNAVCNPNPEVQAGTAYRQYDVFNKMIFKISDKTRIQSNIQYSTSSNVPRFDQLNDGDHMCVIDTVLGNCVSGKDLKFHSYYYGPQKRLFSSLSFIIFDTYFDKSDFILGYQKIQESRHKWKLQDFMAFNPDTDIGSDLDQVNQLETVNVYSMNMNFRKGSLFFGSETIYNSVISESLSTENMNSIEDTRYPSEGSSLFSTALYVNMLKRFSHKIQLESGIRYTFSKLIGNYPEYSEIGGGDLYDLLNESSSLISSIMSGNLKIIYYPKDSWKISSVTSRGFHAPNVDDMFKIHLKAMDNGYRLTVPYKDLKPEYSLSQEISITKEISPQITLYGTGFYTSLKNSIILDTLFRDAGMDGQEWIVSGMQYDGEFATTFANQNSKEYVNIYGLTFGLNAKIAGFKIAHDINITKYINNDGNHGAFAHIPPVFGKLDVIKDFNRWRFRLLCLFSGSKNSTEFDNADIDNLSETPVIGVSEGPTGLSYEYAGLPSWYTLNFSTQYNFSENLTLQFSIDNILNTHYKTFGSGISAPGRSLIAAINYNF